MRAPAIDPAFEMVEGNGDSNVLPPFVVPALTHQQLLVFRLTLAIWFATIGWFWGWWLRPEHIDGWWRFGLSTAVAAWLSLMPLYFLAVVLRAVKPSGCYVARASARIAMVVTKAPSEPFAVVMQTLEAMLSQTVRHDTWLADEDPSPETREWCARHGVHISTRKGAKDYHRSTWPRRTCCKEGNLAYFYDHSGYARYDFVVQMDADHVPTGSYLAHMIEPFADPTVGYVSAPSICDKNAKESWAARGRMFPEGMFHGPLQAGHTAAGAPLCIGSHYAVRTRALKEAGGLGPELAEDHSTSMLLVAAGWRGVHAIDAIAHGDGPQTFADMITQEFQWSRSLITILLEYSPSYLPKMSPGRRFEFIFCQLWYPLFATFSLIMFFMPIVALMSGKVFANVTFPDFVIHYSPNALLLILLVILLNRFGLSRPVNAKPISWEGTLFLYFARWPWVVAGSVGAICNHITRSFVDFRVTPKGRNPKAMLPLRISGPYLFLSIVSAIPVFTINNANSAVGFYWFASLNAVLYAILAVVILLKHLFENGLWQAGHTRGILAQSALVSAFLAVAISSMFSHGLEALSGLQRGIEPFQLVRTTYVVSGAGAGGEGGRTYHFDPGWNSALSR
jgi:cellulose synthase/poly-beta-1,6-N-acetylglucosamine synthase-like glycosyltransferase